MSLSLSFLVHCVTTFVHPSARAVTTKSQLLLTFLFLCQSRLVKICMSETLVLLEMRQASYKSHLQERACFFPNSTLHVRHVQVLFGLCKMSFLLLQKHKVPWDTLAVKKKHDEIENTSLCKRRNPTNANTQKLRNAQSKLNNACLKEQTEYIQGQINKIKDLAEDRQSTIACQTVNEVNRRKSTASAKLKTAGQEEKIHLWKQHFKNLLRKSSEVTDEPSTKTI